MNFRTFSVATTTIFPISNSVSGGQLLTEWNLRSRDFVSSLPSIQYDSATSYVHGLNDYDVRVEQDDTGTILSNSTLEILPGTAILNGHYVKQEAHMFVDLLKSNKDLKLQGKEPLTGKLGIGLKVYYSTEATMVGAMVPENSEDMYEGVEVIVLPASLLKTPEDSPKDQSKVTCDLKLATFTFLDNEIRGVINNPDKIKYVQAERISNIDDIISDNYLSKGGINPKKLYVLAGKNVNGTINNTWCDATDSLFVWDKNPIRTSEKPDIDTAQFVAKDNGVTALMLPHKNVDGMKVTTDPKSEDYGKDEYYESVEIDLPVADFSTNTSGTVDSSYTKRIKAISAKTDKFFKLIKGKQVAYIENMNSLSELPPINVNWNPGDYTLVDVDNYALAAEGALTLTRPPSTLYAILPGSVKAIKFFGTGAVNSGDVPEGLTGVQLGSTVEKDTAPITSKTVQSADLTMLGTLGETDIVPGTASYTTPEGIIYKDNGKGELVYSEDNTDSLGKSQVLEACVESFDSSNTSQLYTISKKTISIESNSYTGYAIECNGLYLTATKEKPFKLYFSKELTIYGLFVFVSTDNKLRTSFGDDSTDGIITDDKSKKNIRPVELLCIALIRQDVLTEADTNLLTGVQELIDKVNSLTDKSSTTSIPYMKTLIDAVTSALNTADSETATSKAADLKTVVDKVFAESDNDSEQTKQRKKDAREAADSAKKAVDSAASYDTQSVADRIKKVNEAYDKLNGFNIVLDRNISELQDLVTTVKDQADATIGGKTTDYSIYGRVTAYYKDDYSYAYVSDNTDMQQQMWQVMETGDSISIFNSFYGLALTEQDSEKLKSTKYIINYEDGSISGLPMIGSTAYQYYSSNILTDLLNYFTVTDETHGVADEDYFVYRYRMDDSNYQDYYYVVSEEGTREWSKPVWLTGTISLATTEAVGGFLNVPDTALDGGYVKVTEDGYLQLVDYALLRTGAAAYQLGQDIELTSGIASSDIQAYLDEYVNDRVAFPNSVQTANAKSKKESGTTGVYTYPEVIHVTVNISAEEESSTITLQNIDSRFNGSVYLHITGTANSKNTIILSNIQKLRLDSAMEYDESDPPTILISNCGLYYDSSILNKIAYCNRNLDGTGISGLSFWYDRYESTDSQLVVDGMTISEVNTPKVTDVIDFWNAESPNDNHYHVALHSITFGSDGTVYGAGLLVANDTTSNIQQGNFISAANFTLPQGSGLNYPEKLLTKRIKITGTFESGYVTNAGFVMQDTKFTALTQAFDSYNNTTSVTGSILFHVEVNIIPTDFGGVSTEAWEPDTYHMFRGVAI